MKNAFNAMSQTVVVRHDSGYFAAYCMVDVWRAEGHQSSQLGICNSSNHTE